MISESFVSQGFKVWEDSRRLKAYGQGRYFKNIDNISMYTIYFFK